MVRTGSGPALQTDHAKTKGATERSPLDLFDGETWLALLRLLGLLGLLRHGLIPPFWLGCAEGPAAPPRSPLPPGTQPACAGSFALHCAPESARQMCPLAMG